MQDSLNYDSLGNRPLPGWLINQKEGLNTIQPQKIVMKEDNSILISFAVTTVFVILLISILSVYFLRKSKKL